MKTRGRGREKSAHSLRHYFKAPRGYCPVGFDLDVEAKGGPVFYVAAVLTDAF